MRTLTILIFLFQRTFDGHIYYLGCEPELIPALGANLIRVGPDHNRLGA
jgi:hypothetical protein